MVKPVSLSNEAYDVLSKMKTKDESFSDVVMRLANKKKFDISRFAGKWPDKEGLDKMQKEVEKTRKNFKLREVKF